MQGGLLLRADHGRDDDGLRSLPCGDLPVLHRFNKLHALRRRNVRPHRHCTDDSAHDVLQRGGAVLATGDLAHAGCDGLFVVSRGYICGSFALPDGGQHGLHALPCRVHH